MKVNEIGSFFEAVDISSDEFCLDPPSSRRSNQILQRSDILCESGRGAITLIIRDICSKRKNVSKPYVVYLPNYCCDSMLQPFLNNGFDLRFYEVEFSPQGIATYSIDPELDCHLFVAISYFGYSATAMNSWVDHFNSQGITTIEDVTHRALTNQSTWSSAKYHFGSLRKWIPIATGAFVRSNLELTELPDSVSKAGATGWKAMNLKARYLQEDPVPELKRDFLEYNREHNRLLGSGSPVARIDPQSREIVDTISFSTIAQQRCRNASALVQRIRSISSEDISTWQLDTTIDVPLFVPIFVHPAVRSTLLSFLRERAIYAPVHWPVPTTIGENFPITHAYSREISLPCDQRYGVDEMHRIVDSIKEFYK